MIRKKRKTEIKEALNRLNKTDVYSMLLFIIYKMRELPEYSTLSELVYILDNENFINLINYYGGKTIRIPKVDELSTILDALLVYEREQNTDLPLSDICKDIGINKKEIPEILKILQLIPQLIDNYDFKRETNRNKN